MTVKKKLNSNFVRWNKTQLKSLSSSVVHVGKKSTWWVAFLPLKPQLAQHLQDVISLLFHSLSVGNISKIATKCLLNAPRSKIVLRWLTVCHILKAHCSHVVTPRWLDDAKECTQSAWSKQRDSPSAAGAGRLERCISRKLFGDYCRTERASNERYFSFNWKLVIIKHEKLFAAKFCPETNMRFIINCSQLLPPRPYTLEPAENWSVEILLYLVLFCPLKSEVTVLCKSNANDNRRISRISRYISDI